jgi:hypothetical protein
MDHEDNRDQHGQVISNRELALTLYGNPWSPMIDRRENTEKC